MPGPSSPIPIATNGSRLTRCRTSAYESASACGTSNSRSAITVAASNTPSAAGEDGSTSERLIATVTRIPATSGRSSENELMRIQ